MLLKGAEILEGEIQAVRQSKKTTTRTTVTKKGMTKDSGTAELKG